MTTFDNLETLLTDTVFEGYAKIGTLKEPFRLYYPKEALENILNTSNESLSQKLKAFKSYAGKNLGEITISDAQENRLCFSIPAQGIDYSVKNGKNREFIKELIDTVSKHDSKIEDIIKIFKKYSDDFIISNVALDDFDYVLHSPSGKPDNYCYCFKNEDCHLIYHRFLKEDFISLGFKKYL